METKPGRYLSSDASYIFRPCKCMWRKLPCKASLASKPYATWKFNLLPNVFHCQRLDEAQFLVLMLLPEASCPKARHAAESPKVGFLFAETSPVKMWVRDVPRMRLTAWGWRAAALQGFRRFGFTFGQNEQRSVKGTMMPQGCQLTDVFIRISLSCSAPSFSRGLRLLNSILIWCSLPHTKAAANQLLENTKIRTGVVCWLSCWTQGWVWEELQNRERACVTLEQDETGGPGSGPDTLNTL